MLLKKIARQIHLWLGLASGLVIFVVAITGAVYCFAPELQQLQSYRSVPAETGSFLPPSRLRAIAEKQLPGKFVQRIYYSGRTDAVMVLFLKKEEYNYSVFLNPYNGELLRVRNNDRDFLTVVLQVHRTLLLPYGHDIISWSTVIFIVMLVTGMVLWWPKNKRTAKYGFVVKWNASPKRFNYDLHKVLGFYASWILIFTALTGLMFSFEKFADLVYQASGYSRSIVQKKAPTSNPAATTAMAMPAIDRVWHRAAMDLHGKYAALLFVLPADDKGPILLRANLCNGTLYQTDFRYFDQYSAAEIPGAYVWGRYTDAHTIADHLKRMNYDIHTGAIFGLAGRIALFFAALVAASLPLTGFYFWWGKRKKASRKKRLQP